MKFKLTFFYPILLLSIVVLECNCSSKEPSCIIGKHSMKYYLDSIDLYRNLEIRFANISIYPGSRGGHYIEVEIKSNGNREVLRFYNFYLGKPNLLRYIIMPSFDGKISKQITGHELYSKAFLDFWFERFSWMKSNDILSIGSAKSYYIIMPNMEDSTYHELKNADKEYLDLGYERRENDLKNCGCTVKYRFYLALKKKNNETLHYNKTLDFQRRISTIYSIGDSAFYVRSLDHSGYCDLDFNSSYCKCE